MGNLLKRVLIALAQSGMSREDAYSTVQRHAMRVWKGEGRFLDFLKNDPEVTQAIPESDLEALFDLGYHFKNVDVIFDRVFGKAEAASSAA